MNLNQSKFEAVKIGISLSQQLITASIGLLTIIGGGVVYLVKIDNYNYFSFIPLGVSVIALLTSIYFGYIGISVARNNGFRGWWSINAGRKDFNNQTWSCLAGIFCFLLTTLTIFIDFPENEKANKNICLHQVVKDSDESLELLFSLEAFETGNYRMTNEMKSYLLKYISEIKGANGVFVVGSADKRALRGEIKKEIGSNFELSSLRAESVRSFILQQGVDSNKIITQIKGGWHINKMEYSKDRKVQVFILRKNKTTPSTLCR